jgi:hypothetical protein
VSYPTAPDFHVGSVARARNRAEAGHRRRKLVREASRGWRQCVPAFLVATDITASARPLRASPRDTPRLRQAHASPLKRVSAAHPHPSGTPARPRRPKTVWVSPATSGRGREPTLRLAAVALRRRPSERREGKGSLAAFP